MLDEAITLTPAELAELRRLLDKPTHDGFGTQVFVPRETVEKLLASASEAARLRQEVERLRAMFVDDEVLGKSLSAAEARAEKAEAFKTWVHSFLDGKGVPHDPNPEENERCGCRIGGRLRWVFAQKDEAESRAVEAEQLLREAEDALDQSYDASEWPADGTSTCEQVRDKIRQRVREAGL